jgi:hypothetical protein
MDQTPEPTPPNPEIPSAIWLAKEKVLLVVLSLYSASEDGTEPDCCSLRKANTSGRILRVSLIAAIMPVTVASPFHPDLFCKSFTEWHKVGDHVNLVGAGPRGSRQGNRGDNRAGQGDKQDRSKDNTAQPAPTRSVAKIRRIPVIRVLHSSHGSSMALRKNACSTSRERLRHGFG